jgi:dihydrodipicolinate synthase/N-acetylneuraminate lyase
MGVLSAPRGLIVDLITPLKENGSIDGRGLGRLLDRIMPFAQAVLLASPCMGEGRDLAIGNRLELLEKAMVVIRGRVPTLIWVTQEEEEKTASAILTLRKAVERRRQPGDVFWVDTPLYYHSNRGLPSLYKNLCSTVTEPFILHNDPELIKGLDKPLKRNNIRTTILKELAPLGGIAGLIFSGSFERAQNYQRACHEHPQFRIYDGDEARFFEHPSMSGIVSAGANLAPKAWQRITQSSLQLGGSQGHYPDYLQQVWQLGGYLRRLKELYERMPVPIMKEVLAEMAIIETSYCTRPAVDVQESKAEIMELMASVGE